MARRTTTITSKWVVGGDGQLKDLFPLPPLLKLLLDLLTWLFRHPLYIVLPATFITLAISLSLPEAIVGTFLLATLVGLSKNYLRKSRQNRNHKALTRLNQQTHTVPLDPNKNRKALIALDTSILIGGKAGSGKSNLVWKILKGLNTYQIPYRLHVIDPAGGVELADLERSPYLHQYTDRARHADSVIKQMRDDMDTRLSEMRQSGTRKHIPTPQHPRHILIIDELLLLHHQLQQGVASPLGDILAVGRKAGFIVIACTQLGQVDAIGRVRDLFPQRICMSTRTTEMTDAILGSHATNHGAVCHLISTPGTGYVFTEESGYQLFHTELITETKAIANPPYVIPTNPKTTFYTNQPTQTPALQNQKTATYELYAEDGTAMYIGLTANPNRRFKEHQSNQGWWHQVDLTKTNITWHSNRQEAQDAEEALIKEKRPIYNILHNFGT
jgi:predicted GIY-YIG superfamily endonuclease